MLDTSVNEAREIQRKIAAANLGQLEIYLYPADLRGSRWATIKIPEEREQAGKVELGNSTRLSSIFKSLEVLGFDLDRPNPEIRWDADGYLDTSVNAGRTRGVTFLKIDADGIQKLVNGGIMHPAIDAVRPRTPAAIGRILP